MAHMAAPSSGVLEPWAYGIGRSRLTHLAKAICRKKGSFNEWSIAVDYFHLTDLGFEFAKACSIVS